MKAQVSLEYLIVSVLALAAISISVFILIKIKDTSNQAYELAVLKNDAEQLHSIAEEMCALGSGNSMQTKLNGKIEIDVTGNIMRVHAKNYSITKNMSCTGEAAGNFEGKIIVENEAGTIKITQE